MSNLIINKMEGQYHVIRPLSSSIDLSFHTQIANEDYINISFGIAPNNKMLGQYDVFRRPRIKKKIIPIRDAFVKEDVPTFNYGRREQLRVGIDQKGNRHRSFLLFDISDIDPDLYIVNAKLKLKIANPNYTTDMFEISTSNRKFDEYGVTWANQPTRDQFIDIVDTYPNQKEIEINITDTFMKWYKNQRGNNGIILKEFENIHGKEIAFYSRESGKNAPVLEIEYLDPEFFIPQKHEIDINFNVWKQANDEIPIYFNVESFYRTDDLPIDFFVLSVTGELCMDFIVSQTVVPIDFIIRQKSDVILDFHVSKPKINDLPINFVISNGNLPLNFNVAGIDYKWFVFTVHHPTLPVDFVVTKDQIPIKFNIPYKNDISLNFVITKDYIPIEFEYRLINDLPLLFHIEKHIHKPKDDLPINFSYSCGSIPIDFTVLKYSDLPLNFNVRAVNDISINLYVTQAFSDNIDLDFIVRAIDDLKLDFEVASKFLDIDFNIIKHKQSLRGLNFIVRAINDKPIDFIVAQKNDIDLRFHIQKHLFSDIFILFVVDGEIKRKRAYTFIM